MRKRAFSTATKVFGNDRDKQLDIEKVEIGKYECPLSSHVTHALPFAPDAGRDAQLRPFQEQMNQRNRELEGLRKKLHD
ncbi:MAG: hypothetical protein K2Z81_18590, partial [Cyanobacteria bacterium]|nr:hypothetical protein [Cyanobacteriota bacterium]